MKRKYYGMIGLLAACFLVGCQKTHVAVTDNIKKETQAEAIEENAEYVTLVQYNGECYHYNRGATIIEPEIEAGAIQSTTKTEHVLPTEDWQVNLPDESWLGKKIYINEGDENIYIFVGELDSGEKVYNCYTKGVLKMDDTDADEYYTYVTYNGKTWLLKDEKKEIPEKYKMKNKIHSYGQCYWSVDYTTNLYDLLGGTIYISEDNTEVIYVKALDGRIWTAVPDEN